MEQKSENDNFEEGEIAESSPTFPEFSDQLSSGKNLPISSRLAGGQTPKQNRPDNRYPDARNSNPMLMGSLPTSRPPQPPVPPVIRSTSREQLHHGYNNSQDRYDGPAPIYRDNRGSGGYSERDSLGGGDWVDPRSEYGWSEPSYGSHGVDDWSGPPRDYHDSRDAGGYYDQAPRGPHLQQRYPPIARGSSTGALSSYDQQASLDHRGNPNARGYGSGGPGYSGSSSSGHPAGDYPSAYPPSGAVQLGGRPHSDSRDGSFYDGATGPGSAPVVTPRDYKKDLAPPSYEKNPFLNSGGAAAAAKNSMRPAPGAGSHSPPKLKRASSDGDVATNSSSSGPPLPVYNASNKPLPPNIGKSSAPASQAPVKVPIPGSTLHTTMQTAQTAAVKPPPPPPMRPNVHNPNAPAPAPPQLKTSQSSGNLSNQLTSAVSASDQQVKSSQQPPPPAPKPPSRPLVPAVDSSVSGGNNSSSGAGQQARPASHHKIPPPPEPVPPPATLFDTLMKFGQGGSSSTGGGVSGTGVGGNRPLIKVVTGSDAVVNPEHSKVFNSTAPINITAGALAAAATSAAAGGSSGNSSNLEKHLAVGTSSFAYESSLSGTTPKPISLGVAALDKIGLQPRSSSSSSASSSQNDLVSFSFMSNSVSNSTGNVNNNSNAALSVLDPSVALTATPGGAKSLSVSETPKASGIAETLMTPTSTALGGSAVRRPRAAWGSGLIRQTSTSSVVDAVIVPETPVATTAPDATAAESTATTVAADNTPSAAKPAAGDSKTPAATEAKLEPRVEPKVEKFAEKVSVKPEATPGTTSAVDKAGKPSSASSSVSKDVKAVPPPSGPLSRVSSAQDVNAAPSAPASKGPQQTPSQIARKNLQQEKLAAAQQAEQKATQLAAQKQQELQRLEQRKKERSASQTDGLAAGGASSKKDTKESRETRELKEIKETKQEEEEEMDFDAAAPVAAVPAAPLTLITPKNTPKTTAKKTVKPATPVATPVAVPAPAVVVTETKMDTTKVETSKVESKPIKKAALPEVVESDGSEDSGNDSDNSTESASAKLQPPVKKVKTETAAPVSTAASSSGAASNAAVTKEQDQSSQQAKKRKRDSATGASGESAGEEGENGAGGESDVEQETDATIGGTTSPRKVIRFTPTAGENKTEPTDSATDSAAATSPRKRPNNSKVAVALEISAADREALSVITGRGLPRPDLLPGSKKRGRPFAANSKRNPALRDTDDDTAAADGDGEGNDSRPESDAVSANAEQAAAQRKKERARVSDKADKTDKQFGRGRPSTSSQYPTGSGSVKDNERLTAAQMVQQLLAAPPAKLNNKEKKALKERFMLGNLFSKETDVQRACHAIFCMNQLLKGTENNAGGGTGVSATNASSGAANSSSTAGAKDTKDGATAPNPHPNYPFMTQDFSSIHSAHKVFIPTAAEISTFIDFLDGSSDMLYMYMKGIREKQYMSEAVRKDQHTAEQAAATATAEGGDKKVCASDSDSSDVGVTEKATDVESATATTIAPTTTTADGADVVSSAASADEKISEKTTPAVECDAPAAPEGPKIKHNANPPNLLELQHNNQLRIVEAHLFATIINNVSSVVNNNAPTFVAPYAATSSKVTTSGTAPVASGSSNSSTSGNGNKNNNSKDSNSSGNKSSRKGSSTAAPTAAESTAPATTPIVSITDAVNQYMHNSIPVVYFDPQDLPQYTHNVKKMERNRESITREIRARKLHKRRAWEYLGDKYLDIHHKWDTHMTDVEKEEEAAATRDGPKLRNAVNTLSMRPFTEVNKNTSLPSLFSLSNGAAGAAGTGAGVIGRPGAISAATGATNTPGVVSIGGLTASFTNNQLNITSMNGSIANNSLFSNATTGANTSFNSRATGLGIARTDYEQEQLLQTLFASEIRQMKINNGLCEIPDMLSPWPYADNYKPPAMPKWNKNIREFVTGGKNASKDNAAGAAADNKASKAAAKKSAVSGAADGDNTEVKTEGSAQKAEVKVESTGAVKGTENKSVAVPAPRTQNAVAPDAPFPTFKHCYTEYFDTNGSRLTTDGKRQLCCNIPLHNSCPMNCNCALQVDRLAKFERIWTDIEKCIFIDKFMQFPKNFQKIASFLTNRTTKDCIKFYYDSKHTVEYKALLKEFDSRRKTNNKFCWVQTVKAAQYVGAAVYPSSSDNIADPSSKNSIIELPIDDLICSSFTNQPANIARLFNIPIPKLYSIHTPVQLATEQQLHTMATTNIGTGKTTLLRNTSTDGDNSNNSNSNDNQQNAAQHNYFHNGITMPQAIASRSQITQPYPRQSTINTAKRLYSATHNGANLDDVIASALQQETNDTSDNETDAPPAATQAAAPMPKETTRRKNKNKRQSSGGNQNNNSNSSSSASFLPQYFNNGMLSKFPLGPDYSYIVHNERILNEAVIPSHFYGVAEHTAGESSNKQSDAVQRTYYHNAQLYSDFVSAAYNNNYASNGSNNSGNSSSSSSVNRLYDDVTSHTQAASLPNIPSVNVLNNTNRLPSAKKASTPRNPANKTSRVVKGPAPSGMPLPTTASGGSSASGGALINVPRFTPAANSAANAAGAGSADGRVSGIAMMKPQTNPVVDANGNMVSRPAVLPVRRDLIAGRGNRGARRTGLASDRVVGASNAANSGSGNSTAVTVAQSGKEPAKNVPASTANVTAAVTTASAAKGAESAGAAEKSTTEEMDVETPSTNSAATKTVAHADTDAVDADSEIVVYAEESGTESEQEDGEGEDEEESGSDGDNNGNDDDNDGEDDNADGDDQQSNDEDDAEADPTEQQQQQEEQLDEESESEVDENGRPDLSNISRRLASDSESGASSAEEEEEEGDDDGDDGEEQKDQQQREVDVVEDAKPAAEQLDAADVMAEVVAAPTTACSNAGDDDEGMETGHSDHEEEFPSEDVALEGASIEVVDQTLSKPVELPLSVVATAPESVTPHSNAPVASTDVPTHTSAAAAEEEGTEMLVDLDL